MAKTFQPPPVQGQALVGDDEIQAEQNPTFPWKKWFELIPPAISAPATQTVPTAADSDPTPSGFACDENSLYVMTPSGTWKKLTLTAL